MAKPPKPSLAAIAACTAAALVAAGLLAYALASSKPKAAPLPPINRPCSPQPPCDPRLEMPCRAPTDVIPCPAA